MILNKFLTEKVKIFISQSLMEFFRLLIVGCVAILPYLISVSDKLAETGEFKINSYVILGIFVASILKGIDKGLHKSGIAEKGLIRF